MADYFGKAYKHVLKDIDSLLSKIGYQALFFETSVEGRTGFGVRHYCAFDMTRDGFILLAMGITGYRVLDFMNADRVTRMRTGI